MNFDIPKPIQEKEPHLLSLDEIVDKINSFTDTRAENCKKPPQIKKNPDGLVTFVEFEITNLDGSISLLLYTLTSSETADAAINITHFQGDPNEGDYLGADTLATYNGKSAQWKNLVRWEKPVADQLVTDLHAGQLSAVAPQAASRVETVRVMKFEELSTLFDQAETAFGARSMEETLMREANNFQGALDVRNATKPFLNKIYSEMLALNNPEGRWQNNSLKAWNPGGNLSEEQFNNLNFRRKNLVSAIGVIVKDKSGKSIIRHDSYE